MRVFSFLLGFVIGTFISTSSAQLSELEIPRQDNRQAELMEDQKIFQFVNEQAVLWNRLANAQDEFFQLKWNKGTINLALQTEMKFIRKELLARDKQVRKFLEVK
jgi:hypothetical protein